eukprot:TRINITY_DN7788_c0_g1_i1.p1 TRINITY_DN7788_c0_g1~~TRINITY_DN7788_c0_g1_i1.p1  ORF type:complete len:142 (+),score=23.23 TRINITY_DN7788_c0_g1_i1:3-428(+)
MYCEIGKEYNIINTQLDTMEVPKMKNLSSFMFDQISILSYQILMESSDTLEKIIVGMDDFYSRTLQSLPYDLAKFKLAKLEQVTMIYLYEEFIPRQSFFRKLKRAYPLAQIQVEKVKSYVSFANVLLKKLGVDNGLRFVGV